MTIASPVGLVTAQATTELDHLAGSIETVFLESGERLGDAVGCWRAISSSFGSLAAQYECDDMRRCVEGLSRALNTAASLGTRTNEQAQGLLGDLGSALSAMQNRLNRLNKTIAEVKLVALNAKVEVAHLDVARADFSVFTGEIDRLAIDAAGELSALAKELRHLDMEMSMASSTQAGFSTRHGAELQSVCQRLSEGLALLSSQRQRIADAASQIGSRSNEAGDHIAEVVSALQIGDISRQRTEHVSQALTLLGDLATHSPGLSPEDALHARALVSTLQATQLDQTADSLDRDAGEVARNLSALAEEAVEVGRLGRESFAGANGTSFLENLGTEISRVQTLLEGYGEALTHTEATMRSVTLATKAMVSHVETIHSIEADLKVMALNASFKCARLGDKGRTLEVVAQNLRQLASRTVEDAEALMSGLGTATRTAESLTHDQGETDIDKALDDLRQAAATLSGTDNKTALSGLESDSVKAQTLLHEAAQRIGGAGEFSSRLRQIATRLRQSVADITIDPSRIDILEKQILANLTSNYTMASERSLHEMFSSGATAPTAESDANDLDDILF